MGSDRINARYDSPAVDVVEDTESVSFVVPWGAGASVMNPVTGNLVPVIACASPVTAPCLSSIDSKFSRSIAIFSSRCWVSISVSTASSSW